MYVDELFIVVFVFTHILDDTQANGGVLILVAIELVREGVEKAVAVTEDGSRV